MAKISKYTLRSSNEHYLIPDWPAPSWIKSAVSTRKGSGQNNFDCFNIAHHVNDDIEVVMANREQLKIDLSLRNSPFWIEQVHGIESSELLENEVSHRFKTLLKADASYTKQVNLPCVVMTADCLPILLCNKTGTWISAIHAGWRGLCNGIIESTVANYEQNSDELIAWLGPAISQNHFEVGAEVRKAFLDTDKRYDAAFIKHKPNYYMADLYFIAREKLSRLKIKTFGGDRCTYDDSERFYSYRRDGETGRMASLIWIKDKNESS